MPFQHYEFLGQQNRQQLIAIDADYLMDNFTTIQQMASREASLLS